MSEELSLDGKLPLYMQVSRVTVRKAILELINDGRVYQMSMYHQHKKPVTRCLFYYTKYIDASKQERNLDGFYLDVFKGVSDELRREEYKCVYVAPFGSKKRTLTSYE